MKLPTCVLFLALAYGSTASAEEFTTSAGIRSVPPLGVLIDERGFLQAGHDAETILIELIAELNALDREAMAFPKEPGNIAQKRKEEQALMDQASARFAAANKKYLEGFARFEQERIAYETDVVRHGTEVDAINRIPYGERDQATVARLRTTQTQLDTRKAALDSQRAALTEEHDAVEALRSATAKFQADAEARLKGSRDVLLDKLAVSRAKQDRLHGQLRQAVGYLTKLRATYRVKFNKSPPPSATLQRAVERLDLAARRSSAKS
jgi:predicted  nucleic acid-binding Zn-ribbon protein